MACVHRFERPLGPGQPVSWAGVHKGGFASREEAAGHVEEFVATFPIHGFNAEEGYWWCRSAHDVVTTLLAVCSDDQVLFTG